jgi:DNA polymerase-3 subunit alpha
MSSIPGLFKKAKADGQTAIAITDHGNLFGVKEFLKTAKKFPEVKPIVGCEVYVAAESRTVRRGREDQSSNHLVLLAKNLTGYHNLVKLVSLAYIEGFHYKPRIDHELLERYHDGLIACSACLAGEVPRALHRDQPEEAEKTVLWYKRLFGDDYYLELQRHETGDPSADASVYPIQQKVGTQLIELAKKHQIKLVATNDVHFVDAEDAEAHDRLICLNTGADLDDAKRLRYTKQEWLKTQAEMAGVFYDLPEALANTLEIADKIERYSIDNKPIMPNFPLPDEFSDANEYLHFLSYRGAEKRYREITPALRERIDYELATIKKMGFPDYFLIVQDFIAAARSMGVWVGPGRGSAAGSVVAYCLQITDIDPLPYNLLFERFLNPDRISMPDIDIDFDDDGRAKVLKYVEDKYGKDHVSHVITFGTMAARSAIRDIARVQRLPLSEADRLAKEIPQKWDRKTTSVTVDEAGNEVEEEKDLPITLENCIKHIPEIKQAAQSDDPLLQDTLKFARKLEGSVRNTGVHACAIIIGRNNLMEHIPISTAKDKDTGEDMWVSQYEGSCIEDVGMLKMDFLGLTNLSILRDAIENVKLTRGIDIELDKIPIDDAETYELFSRGDTIGTFQFESEGMRKVLRDLRPTRFEDLIAVNALYRPGPMDYINQFVQRKHGLQKITYDLPEMEEFLNDTYGITVYQEQVMLLSQKLAGFTGGQADTLRKAMGKKQLDTLAKMKNDFIAGAVNNGHSETICAKIWGDWVSFAKYAFNKSHSTCYAMLGYQTGYMKAHYPAEYMAALLSRVAGADAITKFMDECRRMDISVQGPSVNESTRRFTVNKKGNIRFGMAGLKGVGAAAVDAIVNERNQNGLFQSVYDFVERVPLTTVNRRTMDALVLSGAFDEFKEIKRHHFFAKNTKDEIFLDSLLYYGNKFQADKQQHTNSLFGGQQAISITKPAVSADVEEWSVTETLKREKELVGMYLSAHPLDIHKFDVVHFTNCTLPEIPELLSHVGRNEKLQKRILTMAGIVTKVQQAVGKTSNKPYMRFTLEDYSGTHEFSLFGNDYVNFSKYIQINHALYIQGSFQTRFQKKNEPQQPGEWELRIKSIYLLAHVRDELIRNVQISLTTDKLSESLVRQLTDTIVENSKNDDMGKRKELLVHVYDPDRKFQVNLFSRHFRVSMNADFIAFLEREKERGHLDFKVSV